MDGTHLERESRGGERVALLDPGSSRILEVVGDLQIERRGRGVDLAEICDRVIQGPLTRREVEGPEGTARRVHSLAAHGYLRLDPWGVYRITAKGWNEGLGRPPEVRAGM